MLLLLLPVVFYFALSVGSANMQWSDWVNFILGNTDPDSPGYSILKLRITRTGTAFFAGAVLSVCGLFMQALVRNPLADPYLLGSSSGAGFGVVLLTTGMIPFILFQSVWFLPVLAFAGSLLSLIIVMGIGHLRAEGDTYRLLIAGVAVSSFFTALTGLVIYLHSDDDNLRSVLFWTLGSFNQSTSASLYTGIFACGLSIVFGWIRARQLDVLVLGDAHAQALGLNIRRFRVELLLICAVTAGSITAFCGPVGFVGLMIPHFTRGWLGAAHGRNMLVLPLTGGLYLVLCDTLSRMLVAPAGLPIGIITALFGVPFFLFLLGKKSN